MKARVALLVTAILLASCTSGPTSSSGPASTSAPTGAPAPSVQIDPNGVLKHVSTSTPTSFDPIKAASLSGLQYLHPIYDMLVYADAKGNPEPMLATAWKFTDSPAALDLTLRTDVKFRNGTPFDANVVKANLERAKGQGSVVASSLEAVSSVTVVDASHVRLNLKGPSPDILGALSDRAGIMVDPAFFSSPDLATKGAGTGPYVVSSFKPGAEVVYKRAESYWNPAAAPLAELRWIEIDNDDARLNAVITGDADLANLTSPDQIKRAKNAGLVLQTGPSLQNEHMKFNTARSEFGKQAVRQAINFAIDRKTMVNTVLENTCVETSQYPPPGNIMHSDQVPPDYYAYNATKAKDLLAQAGLPNGFTFTALVVNSEKYVAYAQVMQADLAKIGVKMNLQPTPSSDIVSAFYVRKVGDAIISGDVGSNSPTQYAQDNYLPNGTRNPGAQSTPQIVDLVGKVATTSDDKQRATYWGQLTKAVTDHAFSVQICQRTQSIGMNARVIGFKYYLNGGMFFRNVAMAKK